MKKITPLWLLKIASTVTLLLAGFAAWSQFSAGNIVVYRVGDGAGAITSAAAPIFIDQYTSGGTFVNALAVPTTGGTRLVSSGSATSEGKITLASDGSALYFGGYDAAVGTASIANTTAATANRAIGKIDNNYVFTRPFSSTTFYNASNIRGVASNGTHVWASGNSSTTGGINYYGPNAAVNVSNTVANARAISTYNGQLYFSTGSGTRGIYKVGTGLPTTSGQTSTLLIGTGGTSSPYSFAINSTETICYIADDRNIISGGGVQRWDLIAGVWTLSYTLAVSTLSGSPSCTVDWSGPNPVIYAIGLNASTTDIVKITDTGAGSTYTVLASSAANTFWRGIAFAPTPPCTPTTWYLDSDGDGYGNPNVSTSSCTAPLGYVASNTDCDDSDADVNPGETELCANNTDDDCDGFIDEDDAVCQNGGTPNTVCGCDCLSGYTGFNCQIEIDSDGDGDPDLTDCAPFDSNISHFASELCANSIDDDCDGSTDEDDAPCQNGGTPNVLCGCDCPVGYVGVLCEILADSDGDGDPDLSDCAPFNSAVSSLATEICGNLIDDNCNGFTDEGCTLLPNDDPAGAYPANVAIFPACAGTVNDLTGAVPSLFAQSTAITGEDLWFSFVAQTSAIDLRVFTSAFDALIELQDAGGNMLDYENVVSGIGIEYLNYSGLVTGQTYIIGVRNYDSSLGTGSFSLCVEILPDSRCDYGPGPYTLCQTFKADWVGAAQYIFNFTSQTTNQTYTKNNGGSTFCVLSTVPGLTYGDTYDVRIDCVWNTEHGDFTPDPTTVTGDEICSLIVSAQPTTIVRPSDNCANFGPHLMGQSIAAQPFVCGAINWKWEFTRTDVPELPITHYKGNSNRFIQLASIPGLVSGATYDVRVAPVFSYGDGSYGTVDCIALVGPGLSNEQVADAFTPAVDKSLTDPGSEFGIYPNPGNGTLLHINYTGGESELVQVRVHDNSGRLVYASSFALSDGSLRTIVGFDNALTPGLYHITLADGDTCHTELMIVQ